MNTIHKNLCIAASLLLLMGAGCTQPTTTSLNIDNSNETVVNTTVTNANEIVTVNTNSEQGSGIDTSDWLTFRDDDLDMQFLYPSNYEVIDQEITDFSDSLKYDQDIYAGKTKRLIIQAKEDLNKQIILIANTKDKKSIYDVAFTGGDLIGYCDNPHQITAGLSYCEIVENNGQEFLYRNEFVNMECSPRFNTSISINNPNVSSDFNGLEFTVALPDIQADLLNEPFKDNDPCAGNVSIDDKLQEYLQTSFSENNLSVSDKNLYEITKTLVQSVQSI